jgi:hypothetical protein
MVRNRRDWETGLATLPDAEEPRNVILDEEAIRRLIALAMSKVEDARIMLGGKVKSRLKRGTGPVEVAGANRSVKRFRLTGARAG